MDKLARCKQILEGVEPTTEAAGSIKPGKTAPIEYIYDHPTQGKLSIRYSGQGKGWFVSNAKMKVLASGLLTGLTPMANPKVAKLIKNAVDKELALILKYGEPD